MLKFYPILLALSTLIFMPIVKSQDLFSVAPPVDALVDVDNNNTESVDVEFFITSSSNTFNSRFYFINAFDLNCPSGLSCTYIPCQIAVPSGITLGQVYTCMGKITISETGVNNGGYLGDFTLNFTPSKTTSPGSVDANYSYTTLLPVELSRFDGRYETGKVKLKWETASETNNEKFVIERSADGIAFSAISEVAGRGTTLSEQFYFFIDDKPKSGLNFYRLKQVDFDGKFEYSPIIVVKVIDKQGVLVFPTLTLDAVHFEWPAETEGAEVRILDGHGRLMLEKMAVGTNQLTLDLSGFCQGSYIAQVFTNQGVSVQRIIKL